MASPKKTFPTAPDKEPPISRRPEVFAIKARMAKADFYLSLLDKPFFYMAGLSESEEDIVASITSEIHEFLLGRVNSLFGDNSTTTTPVVQKSDFTNSQVQALKLLAGALEKKASVEKEPEPSLPSNLNALIVDSSEDFENEEYEEEEPEKVYVAPVKAKKVKAKPAAKTKVNVEKRKVTIIDEQGNPKEVESVTQRLVTTPVGLKRHPPASYEQQMMLAHNTVRAMEGRVTQAAQQSNKNELDE